MSADANQGPPRSTPRELREFVRRFEPYGFLEQIGRASLSEGTNTRTGRLFPGPNASAVVLTQFGLAELARFVLRSGSFHRTRGADEDAVVQGMNLVNGLEEPTIGAEASPAEWGIYLMRLGHKQFPIQSGVIPRLPRMLTLFSRLPPTVPEAAAYDIPRRFQQLTGLTIEQFTWVSISLFAILQRSPTLDVSNVIEHGLSSLREHVNRETVERTLALVSCSASDFRQLADREAETITDPRQEHWAFNPLYVKPLIRTTAGRYIAPVPRALMERLVDAPYFELLTADGTAFTVPFGYVFEAYVGWLLAPYLGDRLKPAIRYGTDSRTADWNVFDVDGITQLEAKTGRLRKEAKTTGNAEVVIAALKTHYGQAARQLYRITQRVATQPELALLRGRGLNSLVVFLEPIVWVNTPLFEPLRAAAKQAENVPVEFDPQICSVDAIELLAAHLADHSLFDICRRKVSEADHRYWDWDTYVRAQFPLEKNRELVRCFDEFTKPIDDERETMRSARGV